MACTAPVKAPRSWPKSSLSSSVSESAAQLRQTYGPLRRGDRRCTVSASSSLPTPVSPMMRTLIVPAAARSASCWMRNIA